MAWVVLIYVGIGFLFGAWSFDAYVQGNQEYRVRADNIGGKWRLAALAGLGWPGVVYFYVKQKVMEWRL